MAKIDCDIGEAGICPLFRRCDTVCRGGMDDPLKTVITDGIERLGIARLADKCGIPAPEGLHFYMELPKDE